MERRAAGESIRRRRIMVFCCLGNADCSSGTTLRTYLFGS